MHVSQTLSEKEKESVAHKRVYIVRVTNCKCLTDEIDDFTNKSERWIIETTEEWHHQVTKSLVFHIVEILQDWYAVIFRIRRTSFHAKGLCKPSFGSITSHFLQHDALAVTDPNRVNYSNALVHGLTQNLARRSCLTMSL